MNDKINKEFLFKEGVTEEQIFEYYFPEQIIPNRSYTNPLRASDDLPSCRFYRHKTSGVLYFRDPAYKTYDCFQYVMDAYNLSYLDACEKIYYDLGVLTGDPRPRDLKIVQRTPVLLKILRRKFTDHHLKFWTDHDPSVTVEELEEFGIYALSAAWLDQKQFYNYRYGDISFYYHLRRGYNYQCYKPNYFFENVKFITSPDNYVVGWKGFKRNHHYGVITKSGKCTFFVRRFGINNLGVLTEIAVISQEIWDHFFGEIPIVFTLFDPDKTGYRLAWKYRKQYGTIPLFFTKDDEKDFSDNLLKYGVNHMSDYIEHVQEYYNIDEL